MNARLQLGILAVGLLLLVGVACQDDGDSAPIAVPTANSVEASATSEDTSGNTAATSTASQDTSSGGAAAATTSQESSSASVSTPAESMQEAAAATASAADGASQSGIWVSGTGTVTVAPDLAVLTVGVEARAKTVREALAEAADAMTDIVSTLEDEGVESQDIQTSSFSINPQYAWRERTDDEGGRYSERVLKGYTVQNRATVRLRDLDRVGEMVDLVAEAGGDLTRIEGVRFIVQDPEPHRAEAREAAVEQARAKAEQFARDAGVTLGEVLVVAEGGGSVPAPRAFAQSAAFALESAAATTPISEGELEIRATVQMVFAIE